MSEGMQSDVDEGQAQSAATDVASDPVLLGSGVSILLSLYLFYMRGNKLQGIFVGHWAPTFLAIGSYLRQEDVDNRLQQVM